MRRVVFFAGAGMTAVVLAAVAGVPFVAPALVETLVVLAVGGGGLVLARRERSRERGRERGAVWPRSWAVLELGIVVLTAGSLVRARDGFGTGALPSPTALVALVGAALVGLGLALVLEARMPGRALGVVFEGLMCIAALGLVAWGALVVNNHAPLETALALVPLLADGIVLWLAVRLLGVPRAELVGCAYIIGALVSLLVIDAVIAVGLVGELHLPLAGMEALRLMCLCAMGVAALHPSLRRPFDPVTVRPAHLGTGRLAATLGLTLLAPALFAIQGAAGLSPALPVVLAGSSMLPFLVALYLVRQVQDGTSAEHRAQHDALTGLPNRVLFLDRLEVALASARRSGARVGVMFLDLDRFKGINDGLGHAVGNQLLQAVARRLQGCVREADTVARMGGDEFMVLLPDLDDESACITVAEKIQESFAEPFSVGTRHLVTSASIGIATSFDRGADAETLMKNADIAMYRAKSNGRDAYQLYTADMSARALVKHSLESNLRLALEHDELELYYQPKIDARTRHVVGLEALARWEHPQLGFVPPGTFIPLAEETGLIGPLGNWVLDEACRQLQEWSTVDLIQVPVAINLSAQEFTARQIDTRVSQALARNGLSPDLLELEITESSFLLDLHAASSALHNLRDIGVRCSIDDFGTGYSGLRYLTQIPLYSLKIDQSFVQRIGASADEEQIVDAVITLARSLRMKVIAEGVETGDQAEFLVSRGCDQLQGFLFSPALPPADIARLFGAGRQSERQSAPTHSGVVPAPTTADLLGALCGTDDIGPVDEPCVARILEGLQAPEPSSEAPPWLRRGALRLAGSWALR